MTRKNISIGSNPPPKPRCRHEYEYEVYYLKVMGTYETKRKCTKCGKVDREMMDIDNDEVEDASEFDESDLRSYFGNM